VQLTDAQIKALPTTPILLAVAPGAGKTIVPLDYFLVMKATASYTNINAPTPFLAAGLSAAATRPRAISATTIRYPGDQRSSRSSSRSARARSAIGSRRRTSMTAARGGLGSDGRLHRQFAHQSRPVLRSTSTTAARAT
jgi:hypothetical protein